MLHLRFRMRNSLRFDLLEQMKRAVQAMNHRLVQRIQILLEALDENRSYAEIAQRWYTTEVTVKHYVEAFLVKGMASLKYKRPPGRPSKLTKCEQKELCDCIDQGPEACGYDCGCWNSALIADLIEKRFKKVYHVLYIAELLNNLGYTCQRGRFVADHSDELKEKRQTWETETWPATLKLAKEKKAMLLFGDEASFAQWGTLSYTWAKAGVQPVVKTSGTRRAYKVFGLIDYFSGAFFYKTLTKGKFTSESYQAFLLEVLDKTNSHLVLIQDGARYHTSNAMQLFFALHSHRLTVVPLPPYSPDFNPIEYLWRNLKAKATHLRYFPTFDDLVQKVDASLKAFAQLPQDILALMGKYCDSPAIDPSLDFLPVLPTA